MRPSSTTTRTGDPIVASWEPGERWAWCYPDELMFDVPPEALPYLREVKSTIAIPSTTWSRSKR